MQVHGQHIHGLGDTTAPLGVDAFLTQHPGISTGAIFAVLSLAAMGIFSGASSAHAAVTSSRTKAAVRKAGSTTGTLFVGALIAAAGIFYYESTQNQ